VGTFAGDERVNTLGGSHIQLVTRAAGDDADFIAHARPAAQQHGWCAQQGF